MYITITENIVRNADGGLHTKPTESQFPGEGPPPKVILMPTKKALNHSFKFHKMWKQC